MNTDERDDRLEDLLRTALHDEADGVQPAGDGLSRIQRRVAARRARVRWVRPTIAMLSAAAAVAAGLVAYAVTHGPAGEDRLSPSKTPPVTTTGPVVTPTATATARVLPPFPARGIYPFTTTAQEQTWEHTGGAHGPQAWVSDPRQTAIAFLTNMLAQPTVSIVTDTVFASTGKSATVTLARRMQADSGAVHDVTKVSLVRYRKAWVVVGAADAGGLLRVTTPTAGRTITSPLLVSGPGGWGVDESLSVDIRSANGAGPLSTVGHPTVGNGVPSWSTGVSFSAPPDPAGAVVVIDHSNADGGPARITAVPVRFASTSSSTYPAHFIGVKDGRVTVFASRNGAALTYLTPAQSAPVTDAQVEGDNAYYVQGSRCATTLMSVPLGGGAAQPVATPDRGYRIAGYAVSMDLAKVALFESACANSTQPQGRLVAIDSGTGARTLVDTFPAFPPMVLGDPSWEPDGRHLDAYVRSGNLGGIARYDAFANTQPTQPCGTAGSAPFAALEVDSAGGLWFAVGTGSSVVVHRCANGTDTTVFTLRGAHTPDDLDVTRSGSAVLLVTDSGQLWRWSGGRPVRLTPSVTLQQASW